MQYCLYWIHYDTHLDPMKQGYIGITSNFEKRKKAHSKNIKAKHIKNRIDNGATFSILHTDLSKEDAKTLEHSYRPNTFIGWNLAEGGGIPLSGVGKVLLKGDDRTDNQKLSARNLSIKLKGRVPKNAKEVIIFGIKFNSITSALKELGLSYGHYKKYIDNDDYNFKSSEEVRAYSKAQRGPNISKTRIERKFHYNQYTQ
jgi:predicted GIY-YIG superfamily endonuclease